MAKTRCFPSFVPKLERRAEALEGTFDAQGVANTLWASAAMGRGPGEGLMVTRVLEGRAEELAGTPNAQALTNTLRTLWAYATMTMGRGPGEGVMVTRVLEGREEELAGTPNAQALENTLWAYATMGRRRKLTSLSVATRAIVCTRASERARERVGGGREKGNFELC